jgi:hypothetical protein
MMWNFLIVMTFFLVTGCAGTLDSQNLSLTSDRVNAFRPKTGPYCPPGQIAVVEIRMMDNRYDCVEPYFFEQTEMVDFRDDNLE